MERKKGEFVKYVVVTYREIETSEEMGYFEASKLKTKMDNENPNDIHEIEPISVPLKEE